MSDQEIARLGLGDKLRDDRESIGQAGMPKRDPWLTDEQWAGLVRRWAAKQHLVDLLRRCREAEGQR